MAASNDVATFGHIALETVDNMTGPYGPLFEFLNSRFADRVVMRFNEIEDLLGFALPSAARTEAGWWTNPESVDGVHRLSWTTAKRTASPNLRAMSVLFERVSLA